METYFDRCTSYAELCDNSFDFEVLRRMARQKVQVQSEVMCHDDETASLSSQLLQATKRQAFRGRRIVKQTKSGTVLEELGPPDAKVVETCTERGHGSLTGARLANRTPE